MISIKILIICHGWVQNVVNVLLFQLPNSKSKFFLLLPYISLNLSWEFSVPSRQCLPFDDFLYSHHSPTWPCTNVVRRSCWNCLTSMRACDMKNTSLCFVTRGQVVVVKSKPSHNWFNSRENSSRKVKTTSTVEYSRLKFIFKGKYESNIHYRS